MLFFMSTQLEVETRAMSVTKTKGVAVCIRPHYLPLIGNAKRKQFFALGDTKHTLVRLFVLKDGNPLLARDEWIRRWRRGRRLGTWRPWLAGGSS